MKRRLTTHQGADYIAVLREGQTTDDAIVTIKYPAKADVALAHQFAAAPDQHEALQKIIAESRRIIRPEYPDDRLFNIDAIATAALAKAKVAQ